MSENIQNEFPSEDSAYQDEDTHREEATIPQPDQPDQADEEQPEIETISPENELPPEAQGEANGGPLGCCLGTMVGLLLSLSLAVLSRLYADPLGQLFQSNFGLLGLIVRILMGVMAAAFAIICGVVGWKLGKRFFREYEPSERMQRKNRERATKLSRKA
jgi:hypothetical protein